MLEKEDSIDNTLVSIIVPVHNSSKYIRSCVDSILLNTYKNIELLLIDDGSLDNSLEIMQTYVSDKIKVFHHPNKGVSYTRNRGIRESHGEYLIFVDSDDFIDVTYIETLFRTVSFEKKDIGISGVNFVNEQRDLLFERKVEDNTWTKYRLPLTGGKIFKRSFLIDNNLFYPDFQMGEDIIFNVHCYAKSCCIANISYLGYNYTQHKSSAMHSKGNQMEIIKLLMRLVEVVQNSPYIEKKQFSFFLKKTLVHGIFLLGNEVTIRKKVEIFSEGMRLITELGGRTVQIQRNEVFFINLSVNFLTVLYRFKLLPVGFFLMNYMKF